MCDYAEMLSRVFMHANRHAYLRRAIAAPVLLALAGTAFAASDQEGDRIPVPPMPAQVPQLGDADAVCYVASVEVGGIVKNSPTIEPARKAEAEAMTRRQTAFYTGKLATRMPQSALLESVRNTPASYFAADPADVRGPIMKWCLRAYDHTVREVGALDEHAKKLAVAALDKAPTIDPAKLDGNAKCIVIIGITISSLAVEARTDPKVAQRSINLGAAQHFYLGKLSTRPDQSKLLESLTNVRINVGQTARTRNFISVRKELDGCILPFAEAMGTLAKAALAGMPSSGKPE